MPRTDRLRNRQRKGYDGETEPIHNDNINVFPKLPRAPAGRRLSTGVFLDELNLGDSDEEESQHGDSVSASSRTSSGHRSRSDPVPVPPPRSMASMRFHFDDSNGPGTPPPRSQSAPAFSGGGGGGRGPRLNLSGISEGVSTGDPLYEEPRPSSTDIGNNMRATPHARNHGAAADLELPYAGT